MKLELLFEASGTIDAPIQIGSNGLGTRLITNVTGGSFEGEKLSGKLLASGADWLQVDANGVARPDVRIALQTDDGANIYMHYKGVLIYNKKVMQAVQAQKDMEYGDTYFMTQPQFETGDERYAWLNTVIAVAEGKVLNGGVAYKVYHAKHD